MLKKNIVGLYLKWRTRNFLTWPYRKKESSFNVRTLGLTSYL